MPPRNLIPDAPVYKASHEDMADLATLIASVAHLALRFGAVRIDPPQGWQRPILRMDSSSRFFVRMQTLPAPPFLIIPSTSHSPNLPSAHPDTDQRKRRKILHPFVDPVSHRPRHHPLAVHHPPSNAPAALSPQRNKPPLPPLTHPAPTSVAQLPSSPRPHILDLPIPRKKPAQPPKPQSPALPSKPPAESQHTIRNAPAPPNLPTPEQPPELQLPAVPHPSRPHLSPTPTAPPLHLPHPNFHPTPPHPLPQPSAPVQPPPLQPLSQHPNPSIPPPYPDPHPHHPPPTTAPTSTHQPGRMSLALIVTPDSTAHPHLPCSQSNQLVTPQEKPPEPFHHATNHVSQTNKPNLAPPCLDSPLNPSPPTHGLEQKVLHQRHPPHNSSHTLLCLTYSPGRSVKAQSAAVHCRDRNDKPALGNPSIHPNIPNSSNPPLALAKDVISGFADIRLSSPSHPTQPPQLPENPHNAKPQLSKLPTLQEPATLSDEHHTSLTQRKHTADPQHLCRQEAQPSKPKLPLELPTFTAPPNVQPEHIDQPFEAAISPCTNCKDSTLLLRLRLKDAQTKESALEPHSKRDGTEQLDAQRPVQTAENGTPPQTVSNQASVQPSLASDKLEKGQTLKRRRSTKPPNKRKLNHMGREKWDQDETGRLTKPIIFPDSTQPITLSKYKTNAVSFEENFWNSLRGDKSVNISSFSQGSANGDWRRDPNALEELFWNTLERGVDGKALTVPYGVDVEVEGAFDSAGMSYVEWYGPDDINSAARKDRRKNTGKRKVKAELQMAKTGSSCSEDPTRNDRSDERESSCKKKSEQKQELSPSKEPHSHVGNLNSKGLLRHMPRMPGINHSMYYVGQLFSRFCWHTEDAFLNSVSYLHQGSAEKIWYAVPPAFAPQFEEFATENVFSDNLLDEFGTGQALLMNKTTMFDPWKLRDRGIQVYRVVHKPGSFVLTAPRAYHAGFNCGFNIAEAVNFADPTWFPVGREASRFARQIMRPLCVPWEYLLFHEAKATRDDIVTEKGVQTNARLLKNAAILAKELQTVTTEGERRVRAYAEKTNCRIAMLSDISVLVQKNQLGPEFGHGAGMVCSICGHACHFYAEICGSCDDSFEARCAEHFGEGHRLCLVPEHKTMLVRRHDPVMVADILTLLEKAVGIQRIPSELVERYTSYLRPWETPLKRSGLRLKLNFKLAASRLPPTLTGAVSKYPKVSSQKEKGKRRRKRPGAAVEVKEESDNASDAVKKLKRRKPGKQRPEPDRRRKKVEPPMKESSTVVEVLSESDILPPIGSGKSLRKIDLEGLRTFQDEIRKESLSLEHTNDGDEILIRRDRK